MILEEGGRRTRIGNGMLKQAVCTMLRGRYIPDGHTEDVGDWLRMAETELLSMLMLMLSLNGRAREYLYTSGLRHPRPENFNVTSCFSSAIHLLKRRILSLSPANVLW